MVVSGPTPGDRGPWGRGGSTMRSYDELPDEYDLSEDYGSDEEDEFEQAMQDCGKTDEGFCTMAGSEYCDFRCPFSLSG